MYSQQHGMSSFFGSDKKDFLDSWAQQKDINTQIRNPNKLRIEPMEIAEPTVSEKKTGLKILPKKSLELAEQRYAESKTQLGKERLGMETEDYKARTRERQKVGGGAKASGGGAKPKPKPKPTTDQIEKNKLQQKIHALPTELRDIIKGYTVGDFTSEQRKELTDLYENISYIYEAVSTAQYNVTGEFDTPIYKPAGTAGATPALKSLFQEVADGTIDILEEIERVLNWEDRDRDRHRHEIYGWELQNYGLKSYKEGYSLTNKVATAQLREDKKKIPEFQKELNRILKRADVKKGKTKK
jgi:hypothetical protein